MKNLKKLIRGHKAETESISTDVKAAIRNYVDECDGMIVGDNLDIMRITVRGIEYWIHSNSDIVDLKPESCTVVPSTEEEIRKFFNDSAIALRNARKAYLMFHYLISNK